MSKQKVNVVIAGRSYPLSVQDTKEEEGLRAAAKKINTLITKFEQSFKVADKQDLLAMCALQFVSTSEVNSLRNKEDSAKALKEINGLKNLIESHLQ